MKKAFARTDQYLEEAKAANKDKLYGSGSGSGSNSGYTPGPQFYTPGNGVNQVMNLSRQYNQDGLDYTRALHERANLSQQQYGNMLEKYSSFMAPAPKPMSPEDQLKYAKEAFNIGSGKST